MNMHECPGGCGQWVGADVIACVTDWTRAPVELKKAVWRARKSGDIRARLLAVGAVARWLRANQQPLKKAPKK